jgi:small GTP-binding protein
VVTHQKSPSLPLKDDCRKDPHASVVGMLRRRKVSVRATSSYLFVVQAQIAVDVSQFLGKGFHEGRDSTIEDHHRTEITINGESCNINIVDTGGVEGFKAQQDGWIQQGDGFLLIYDVTFRPTFEDIKGLVDKIKESKKHSGVGQHGYSIMIIGNKDDLPDRRVVSTREGQDLAEELECGFLEVSAKIGYDVQKVLEHISRSLCGRPPLCSTEETGKKGSRVVTTRGKLRRRMNFVRPPVKRLSSFFKWKNFKRWQA